jgi:hypothetical protein
MASGEQRSTGWNALAFDIEIREAEPLSRELIEPRRWCPAKHSTSVRPEFTPPQAIDQHQNNVWLFRLCR